MMKQKKVHKFNLLVLTVNTDELYNNQVFIANLNMLKVFQYLQMLLL